MKDDMEVKESSLRMSTVHRDLLQKQLQNAIDVNANLEDSIDAMVVDTDARLLESRVRERLLKRDNTALQASVDLLGRKNSVLLKRASTAALRASNPLQSWNNTYVTSADEGDRSGINDGSGRGGEYSSGGTGMLLRTASSINFRDLDQTTKDDRHLKIMLNLYCKSMAEVVAGRLALAKLSRDHMKSLYTINLRGCAVGDDNMKQVRRIPIHHRCVLSSMIRQFL